MQQRVLLQCAQVALLELGILLCVCSPVYAVLSGHEGTCSVIVCCIPVQPCCVVLVVKWCGAAGEWVSMSQVM
jgi:hypothetical protein